MYCVLFFRQNVVNGGEGKDGERQRMRQVESAGGHSQQDYSVFRRRNLTETETD